jgi:molecular chaperone GrpE
MKKAKPDPNPDKDSAGANGPVEVHDGPLPSPNEGEPVSHAGGAVVEQAEEQIRRLKDELAQVKDQFLRHAADMDNFRKRTARERTETWARAQADVVSNILDALDDLGRVAHLDPSKTSTQDVLIGVELVERKILKELESAGLERVGVIGEAFDPNRHEAVSTIPAPSADKDHLVSAVFQPGYRFGGGLLRPARVQVQIWSEGA